ncbi:MAG: ATPase V [Clostridiales bacterium]|nr:ATPase V [Clostridiales bacterium]
MAVAAMTHVTVSGLVEELDDVVHACIINKEFHPENTIGVMDKFKGFFPFDQDNPYTEPLRRLSVICAKAGVEPDYRGFEDLGFDVVAVEAYLASLEEDLDSRARRRDELERLKAEDLQVLNQLSHLSGMNANLVDLFQLKHARFRFGRMPKEIYNHLSAHFENRTDVYFYLTGDGGDYIYGMYVMPTSMEEKIDALFLSLHFERIYISGRVHGTPEEAADMMKEEIAAAEVEAESLLLEIEGIREEQRDKLLSCYSYLRYMNDSFDIRRYAGHTEKNFYIMGWVPDSEMDGFVAGLKGFPSVSYVYDDPEGVDDFTPPTKIVNRGPFKLFEPFTVMYGLPSYGEWDPTPVVALVYTLLFGVMFGDVGQGLLLAAAGALMWRVKGMWMGRVLVCTGFASVVFGFLYGSFFGDEEFLAHLLGYRPFHVLASGANTNRMLFSVVFAGVGIINAAMVINIVGGFRHKNYEKALFSVSGIAGMVLYWGILLKVLPLMGFSHGLLGPAFTLGSIVLPVVLIFFRHPLGKLMARSPDWKPASLSDFILENLFEMVEACLSYVSNSISFLRVGAFAISHAAMMMVVYMLAGGAWLKGGNPLVIVLGNLFVAGLEGLLVGIQTLRLMYYELFSRFYTGGGKPFSPMVIDYRARETERIG